MGPRRKCDEGSRGKGKGSSGKGKGGSGKGKGGSGEGKDGRLKSEKGRSRFREVDEEVSHLYGIVDVPFDAPDKDVAGANTPAISLSIMGDCPADSPIRLQSL